MVLSDAMYWPIVYAGRLQALVLTSQPFSSRSRPKSVRRNDYSFDHRGSDGRQSVEKLGLFLRLTTLDSNITA
ncbi:hypothetical protein SLA2020_088880 [Shorea laevis]